NPENGERLLRKGELVGVFPEGVKGVGKPFKDRYQLARFGRGGFVRLALRTRAPIVPVAVGGAEEIHPKLASMEWPGRPVGPPAPPRRPAVPGPRPAGRPPPAHEVVDRFRRPNPKGRARRGRGESPDPVQPPLRAGPLRDPAHGGQPPRAPPVDLVRIT